MVARVAVKGKRFRAFIDGRDISRSFKKGKRGVRKARLEVGDELKRGKSDLFVRVGPRFGGAADSVRFHVHPRRKGAMKLTAKPRRRSHAAPRLHGRLKRPLEELRVQLNGKRIDDEFSTNITGKRFEGRLGAHTGLRYGRNSVRIKAILESGHAAVRKLTFRVPRRRPLVGAGANVVAEVGRAARLDGSASKPSRRGKKLSYRWRVVERPAGSKATVSDRSSRSPLLTPDVPGYYVLELRAAQRGGGAARDTVTVTGTAGEQLLGLPIQTITADGGIQIGVPGTDGSTTVSRAGNWVQLVQLNPDTGGLMRGTRPQAFEPADSGALVTAVRGAKADAIVILTGQGLPRPDAGSKADADLEQAVELLGGALDACDGCPSATPNGGRDLNASGAWSVIGKATRDLKAKGKGLQRGYATQNFGLRRAGVPGFLGGAKGQPGSVNGYLGKVQTIGYQFLSADYVGIDTRYTEVPTDKAPTNQNTIAITHPDGSVDKHDSGSIPNGSVAIHALVLDGSDLSAIDNNTNAVINADGSTNFGQIAFIKELLNGVVRNSPAGTSPVVILQEFGGHTGEAWPGGDSTDWIADTLPTTDRNEDWSGGRFPNSSGALAKSWNQASPMGSVAGNVGVLAGPEAHDVIANFRRPFWDASSGKANPHNITGLTVIAGANSYQRSAGFVSPQPTQAGSSNGRIVGILRRNEQSQWQLSSHTAGAGFDKLPDGGVFDAKAFWDLAFVTAPQPFPCSAEHPAGCPGWDGPPPSAGDLANAELDIAGLLFPGTGATSVRDQYESSYLDGFDNYGRQLDELTCPSRRTGNYSCDVFDALRRQLDLEFTKVQRVAIGIKAWSGFFSYTVSQSNQQILKSIANQAISDLHDVDAKLLQEEAEGADAGAGASNSLLLLSELIEGALEVEAPEALAIAPPALGAISAVIDLSDSMNTSENGEDPSIAVANDTDAINEKVNDLSENIYERYQGLSEAMTYFGSVFVNDWARLQAAATKFEGVWRFTVGPTAGATTKRIAQAANVATGQAVYEALMPIPYEQWVISPRYTRLNGLAALDLPKANTYRCWDTNEANDGNIPPNEIGNRNPIRGSTPKATQSSVGWYGSTELGSDSAGFNGPLANYTVRFLKSSLDKLEMDDYPLTDSEDEWGVQHAGTDMPAGLINPLFQPEDITENFMVPDSLGMDKDEFFGLPNWTMRKLQCGTSNGF